MHRTPFKPLISLAMLLLATQTAWSAEEDIFIRTAADGSVELSNVPVDKSFSLFLSSPVPGKPGRSDLPANVGAVQQIDRGTLMARVEIFREFVAEAARRTNVDARLLHAVIAVESGYNPKIVSAKGAIGMMQLMPETLLRYKIDDATDPQKNIIGGASYLRDLLKLFNNDVSLALAAYNAGENAVIRHGSRIPPYRETAAYVPKVLAVYQKLGNLLI